MECLKPKYLVNREMVVPCGACPFCAATKRSDWALRLLYESKKYIGSKFVTLTYADHNLRYLDGNPQLVKSDLQKWFKRVRKAGNKLRYFAVGEYGSKTYRPHYHIILFGNVSDEAIRKGWSYVDRKTGKRKDIGIVHIGQVTPQSIMYCLGYVVNGKAWQMKHHRVAPFTVMSRRPGLGSNYLSPAMIEWHKSDRKNYALLDGQKRHLPRYYKEKIFSKLDRVRIAVRAEKEQFQKLLRFIRDPRRMRMRDPLQEYEDRRAVLAKRIRFKSKENLII